MTRHDDTVALRHMRDYAAEAVILSQGRTRRDLDQNRLLTLGLTKLVEVVGEAANRVSQLARDHHPDIPWRQIVATRNRLVHGYDEIDYDVLWKIVSAELPLLHEYLQTALKEDPPMPPEPTKHDLIFTRVFNASVEELWKVWTDPDLVMRWWGPAGFTSPSARMDVREGGTSLVCMRAPDWLGGQDMYSTWKYTRIVPLERIEYIHNLSDSSGATVDPVQLGMPPDFPPDVRNLVTFKDLGNGRTELVVTEYDWPEGQMMELSKMGMEQCLDKMAAILEGR